MEHKEVARKIINLCAIIDGKTFNETLSQATEIIKKNINHDSSCADCLNPANNEQLNP